MCISISRVLVLHTQIPGVDAEHHMKTVKVMYTCDPSTEETNSQ